jgi:hypothetical protein
MRRLLVGLVVAAASGIPAPCTARGTPALVRRFFRVLSAGRVDQLDPFFAPATTTATATATAPPTSPCCCAAGPTTFPAARSGSAARARSTATPGA